MADDDDNEIAQTSDSSESSDIDNDNESRSQKQKRKRGRPPRNTKNNNPSTPIPNPPATKHEVIENPQEDLVDSYVEFYIDAEGERKVSQDGHLHGGTYKSRIIIQLIFYTLTNIT